VYKDIKLNNSVFDLSRYKRVKWWNIPGHIKRFVHMGKALYRRGKYGFTPLDVWNLHYYLSEHISNLLIFLKNNGQGYPIYFQQQHPDDEEAAVKEWHDYLESTAKLFGYITLDSDEENDKLRENWINLREEYGIDDERTVAAWDSYIEHSKMFNVYQEKAKDAAFVMLNERFFDLWD